MKSTVFPAMIGLVISLLVVGCTSAGREPTADSDAVNPVDQEAAATTPLSVAYATTEVYCDGTTRVVGELSGAEPGEVLSFETALPIEIPDVVADPQGTRTFTWSCEPEEARLRWEVVATGRSSGRTATLAFTGSEADPDAIRLRYAALEEPFLCDGELRPIGVISGAAPQERFEVSSIFTGTVAHTANNRGEVALDLKCVPGEAAAWEFLIVTEDPDESPIRFTVTGTAPAPGQLPELTALLTEDPFVCDGTSREFAVISQLFPFEVVSFRAEGTEGLIDGRADHEGNLAIRWQCAAREGGQSQLLTATGTESGQTITIAFATAEPVAGTVTPLVVTLDEDPFVCDGGSRQMGSIQNLLPNEFVDFVSPDTSGLRQGQADVLGELRFRWQCDPTDAGQSWEVTATGAASGKSVTMTITGAAP